jgi:hypothetical protein
MEVNIKYNHWIKTDSEGRIIEAWSDGANSQKSVVGAILLTSNGSYQFKINKYGEESPAMFDKMHNIPLYKWNGTNIEKRTKSEIENDIKGRM